MCNYEYNGTSSILCNSLSQTAGIYMNVTGQYSGKIRAVVRTYLQGNPKRKPVRAKPIVKIFRCI